MRNSHQSWHAFVESSDIATCSGRIYEHVLSVCFSFVGQIKDSADSNLTIREYMGGIRKAISRNFASRNKLPFAREQPDIRISDQTFGITTLLFLQIFNAANVGHQLLNLAVVFVLLLV